MPLRQVTRHVTDLFPNSSSDAALKIPKGFRPSGQGRSERTGEELPWVIAKTNHNPQGALCKTRCFSQTERRAPARHLENTWVRAEAVLGALNFVVVSQGVKAAFGQIATTRVEVGIILEYEPKVAPVSQP